MYEFNCEYCGKLRRVASRHDASRFCSRSCAKKWEWEQKGAAIVEGFFECVYQPESIMCDRKICSKCGWNPEVAKARLEAITGKAKEG